MKRSATIFFQIIIVLIGISVLAFMLWEPHLEGRNVHATLFEIYFKDLFLACAYIASIAFFTALYQAFKILGYIRQNQTCSQATFRALRTIKYCAIAIIGFVVVGVAYLFIAVRGKDDIAGGVAMGVFITFGAIIIVIATILFERFLQKRSYQSTFPR